MKAHLDQSGNMSSTVTIVDYGAKAFATAYHLANTKTEKLVNSYKSMFAEILPSLKLSDFSYDSNKDSSWIQFKIEQPDYIIKSGELRFLPVDFIYAGRLPVLKKKERIHPIWFGGFKRTKIEIDWTFDDSWKVDFKPDSINTECETVSYSYNIKQEDDSSIKIVSLYISHGDLIEKENYKEARKFRRALTKGRNMKLKLESTN